MNKKELKLELSKAYNSVLSDLENISEADFYVKKNGKWSAAENLAHLSLSAKVLIRGMKAPKGILVLRFGLHLGKQKNYEWIESTYLKSEMPTVTGFEPRMDSKTSLVFEKEAFIRNHDSLLNSLNDWKEWQLNIIRLPQLVLGKLSVREMLLFFIYHIKHHQKAIRLAIQK